MAGKPAKHLKDKVKLSQLRALATVAATGSFSEAALQLNVSQSTVSHSIAALENALGVVLIHRGRQGATLTPVGDRIFTKAQQALSLVDDMGHEATRAKGVEGGLVRIAAFRSMASEVLPGVIAHLHQRHPTIQIIITEFDGTPTLTNALIEGQADFAVASLLVGDEFQNFHVINDPFIALLPPDCKELQSPLTWADLYEHPLITSSSDCCKVISHHLRQANPPVEVDYLISNDSTSVSMTRQGLGISLLPKLAALPIPSGVRIAQLPFEIDRPLGISWLTSSLLTPAAYAFLESFKDLYSTSPYDKEHRDPSSHKETAGYAVDQLARDPVKGEVQAPDEKTVVSATRHH